jgi:hypothetical protein
MFNGKIINIELNPNKYGNLSTQEFSEFKKIRLINEAKQAAYEGYNAVIAILLVDGLLSPVPNLFSIEAQVFKNECQKLGIEKCILLSGQGGTHFPVPLAFDEIWSIDYTLQFTYNTYKTQIENNSLPNYTITDKFLFLGGVPSRLNRIGLLYKFYKENMLNKHTALWSFFKPIGHCEAIDCRKILSHVNQTEYELFLNFAENRFDNLYYESKHFFLNEPDVEKYWYQITEHEWVNKPALIDSNVFSKTSLSIISEGPNYWSHSNNNNFVTEKFWRAVLHRHPFVFSGELDQYLLVKNLGFKTFEEYLEIPEYAYMTDKTKQLSAIVHNTRFFLNNQNQVKEKIIKDVDHNYNLVLNCVHDQQQVIKSLQDQFNIDQTQIDYYFNQTGYKTVIA